MKTKCVMLLRSFIFGLSVLFITLLLHYKLTLKKTYTISSRFHSFPTHPENDRIFFHATDERNGLDFRQTCAVESAAQHNPTRSVQVFHHSARDIHFSSRLWENIFKKYSNIQIILLDEPEYFANTPLQKWYEEGLWVKSPYKTVHMSDYARMLTLYKGGGFYLDLDIITLRPLDKAKLLNFLVIEDKNSSIIPNSVFHFQHGHRFIDFIMRYLVEEYDPAQWMFHGPEITTAIMRDYCGFQEQRKPPTNFCRDVKLLPYDTFFSIVPEEYDLVYKSATKESLSLLNQSYGVHIWNSKSQYDYFDMRSNQLYATLARQHCPITVEEAATCFQ